MGARECCGSSYRWIKQNMNSVILLILITFEACIYSKYLLVEISVGQIKDDNSKEHERNQFLHHPNKDAFPHSILTLKGLERDEQPITSKGLSGIKNFLSTLFFHNLKTMNNRYFSLICSY